MKIIRHILITAISLMLLAVLPLYMSGAIGTKDAGPDAVASASVIIDQPSGAYVVWINRDNHPIEENLSTWERFFSGEEIDFLFEDISCMVAGGDASAMELAESFRSRLPENQMTLRSEDATLMLSKAYYGRFDIIIMSKEFYEAREASKLLNDAGTVQIISGGK